MKFEQVQILLTIRLENLVLQNIHVPINSDRN